VALQRKNPAAIGVKAPFPDFIEPALATSIERAPSGGRWIHEIKFDGYRVQVYLANEATKIFTRRGHDWTIRFKKVAHDDLAHQSELRGHRRRDRRPRGRWQHRFLGAAERAQG
jgi:ATP-dependent DNA ligase